MPISRLRLILRKQKVNPVTVKQPVPRVAALVKAPRDAASGMATGKRQ